MIANALSSMMTMCVLAALPADAQPAAVRSESTIAMVEAGGAVWTIRGRDSADGLGVRWQSGDAVEEFELDFGGVGRVIDMAAAVRQYKSDVGIALAIASQKSPRDPIEYRLAWGRGMGSISDQALWMCSEPVQTVAADEAYQLLSIAIPMGDSVLMTLQRLTRVNANDDKIETYVVVNHCPVGSESRLLDTINRHYSVVMSKPVEPQPIQDAANSESGKKGEDK